MSYKFLQLNIECGKYLESVVTHIKNNDYDFVAMQEINAGRRFQIQYSEGIKPDSLKLYPTQDCFQELLNRLPDYQGELVKSFEYEEGRSYAANAIIYKKKFTHDGLDVIEMSPMTVDPESKDALGYAYKAMFMKFMLNGRQVSLGTGHFTWVPRPYDTDHSIVRARKAYEYLKKLDIPFVFSGDFNVDSRTITSMQFEDLGNNLTRSMGVKNTLNPNLHRAKHLFPEGIACDQLFVSPGILPLSFGVVKEDLSDHYGLALEFDIEKSDSKAIGGLEDAS